MSAATAPDGGECVRYLLKIGADKFVHDASGRTALDRARICEVPSPITISLLDSRIGVLLVLCSVEAMDKHRKRKSQSIIHYLPSELIRHLGKMLG
jgi:hypothetical protein